jgi:hypothetical protein
MAESGTEASIVRNDRRDMCLGEIGVQRRHGLGGLPSPLWFSGSWFTEMDVDSWQFITHCFVLRQCAPRITAMSGVSFAVLPMPGAGNASGS